MGLGPLKHGVSDLKNKFDGSWIHKYGSTFFPGWRSIITGIMSTTFIKKLFYGSILLVVEKWLPNDPFNIEESNKLD